MQRRVEAHDSLDDFPTPPWATRALCEWLHDHRGIQTEARSCREPAANRGHMVKPLREFFGTVDCADVHDYGAGFRVEDYLFPGSDVSHVDWTISNPPFRLADRFIQKALETSHEGVAMIVRSAFLDGIGRYNSLFNKTPPTTILQFSERVVMHKGRLAPKGSTATAYCWLVWEHGEAGAETKFGWIAPCRTRLEKSSDYVGAE